MISVRLSDIGGDDICVLLHSNRSFMPSREGFMLEAISQISGYYIISGSISCRPAYLPAVGSIIGDLGYDIIDTLNQSKEIACIDSLV